MYDDFDKMLEEEMQNPELKKEYEAPKPEFNIIQAVIDARKANNLTQCQLSVKTGIDQADISKLERGKTNPTVQLLQRLADGMDMTLTLEFIPKHDVR